MSQDDAYFHIHQNDPRVPDIQDPTPILLRYTSKILAEAFGRQGDFPLGKFPNAVTDAACNTKIMPVDRVHWGVG